MNINKMKLHTIETGLFRLDGGAMFGIVPKRIWEKSNPPDERNLCTWTMRSLLVEAGDRLILIETGIGNKQDAKFRSHFEPHGTANLMDSLQKKGFAPGDITDVFLTHLHFDHCGGAVERSESGDLVPAFPNAVYWSNKKQLAWATDPNDREKASFLKENFIPLAENGVLKFIGKKSNNPLLSGFSVRFAFGHTEAMMLPVIDTGDRTVVFCADLLPSHWHLPMPWVMAYDIRPLETLDEKALFLAEAVEKNWVLYFYHDPSVEAATLKKDENGRIVVDKKGLLADFL